MISNVRPILHGLSGLKLTVEEKAFLRDAPPMGFLLFARNIESVEQTRALCEELAEFAPFGAPFIGVDQEGGRVQRVKFGGKLPAARVYGEWFNVDADNALEAVRLNALLLAAQLRDVGANWLLGPLIDVANDATHDIIGNRSFSKDSESVILLAKAYAEGVDDGGCLACIKHAPGHGRALVDSHLELPSVNASIDELKLDFAPFIDMAPDADFMMTAHIRYEALDGELPATYSEKILSMMRKDWGFDGLIVADDVGMKALQGDYVERVRKSLDAGCDVAITALSVLKHGMAGTVFDEESFGLLKNGDLPMLNERAFRYLNELALPAAPDADKVTYAKARLKELWADGPARMGYTLDL
ncbi:MAG: beta-N-acetylhexosaminidase [Alphaproteobacteria bacterium]|nr:MAG: beta-N-acetylhexosaminidase [Alphaproteobacteria bacterium]